jgi:hypothetical protein
MKRILKIIQVTGFIIFGLAMAHWVYVFSGNPMEPLAYELPFSALTVFLIGMLCFVVSLKLTIYLMTGLPQKKWDAILKTGLDATGVLEKVVPSNLYINKKPQMNLFFNVKAITGENWQANVNVIMPMHKMYMLAPGTVFTLKYNANNKNELAIVDL